MVTADMTNNDSISAVNGNRKDKLFGMTEFGTLVLDCASRQEFGKILNLLKEMGPSEIDAELRSLDILCTGHQDEDEEAGDCLNDDTGKPLLLLHFLTALNQGLAAKKDYELIVSYLGLCLRIHTQLILKHEDLIRACGRLADTLSSTWNQVDSKFNQCLSILNYVRGLVV
jgi:hypothetical protein